MASIYKEFLIDADCAQVWDAVRDVGAVHQRLVPGMVTQTLLEPGVRTVHFANGLVAREVIIDCDDARCRLAYSVQGGRASHHNASIQVLADGPTRSRIAWTTDVLPDALAPSIGAMMDQGAAIMQQTLAREYSLL